MNSIKYILLLGFVTLTYVNASAISSSSMNITPNTSDDISTDTIVLLVTLISGLLTILTIAVQSLRSDNNTKSDSKLNEKLNNETLDDKIKTIQNTLNSLDVDVHQHIEKKIQSLDNNYTALDKQLSMFTKHLETLIDDRKDESKQLKQELNTIRDNIREDLNDVRKLINEITLTIKLDD